MDREAFIKVIDYLDQQLRWTPMECVLNEKWEDKYHRELYTCRRILLALVGRDFVEKRE